MKTKYLIVGAGISGLTFANYCKGDYLIVEKETEILNFNYKEEEINAYVQGIEKIINNLSKYKNRLY